MSALGWDEDMRCCHGNVSFISKRKENCCVDIFFCLTGSTCCRSVWMFPFPWMWINPTWSRCWRENTSISVHACFHSPICRAPWCSAICLSTMTKLNANVLQGHEKTNRSWIFHMSGRSITKPPIHKNKIKKETEHHPPHLHVITGTPGDICSTLAVNVEWVFAPMLSCKRFILPY